MALVRARRGESCLSSLTCIMRFPGLGSSLSPPASLMRRPLTSPASLVLWSRGTLLRVYVAARRDSDDVPLGRHRLVSSFMRGVKRLRPVLPPSFPSWDLSVVLKGLLEPPFEPLESAPVRILTLKVTLLLALASFKRVGDLQALSVSESCTEFAPGLVKV